MTIRALDGLRGLAVMLVLLSHMSLHDINLIEPLDFSGIGKAGVYLFFALSAFLLTWQALQLEHNVMRTGRYWLGYAVRRVVRIYPLYLVALIVSLAMFSSGQNVNPKVASFEQLLKHLALLDGQHIYWAIPVEFKYYLLLPLVTFILAISIKQHVILPLMIASVAIAGVTYNSPPAETQNNSISLMPYLGIFLLGSLGAAFAPRIIEKDSVLEVLGWTCLAIALLTVPSLWRTLIDAAVPNQVFHRHFLLYGLIWTISIIAAMSTTRFAAFFELASWRFLGRISFSIYLWHYLVVQFVARDISIHSTLQFILVLAVTIPLSWLSYRFIERPFISWGHRNTNHWNRTTAAS